MRHAVLLPFGATAAHAQRSCTSGDLISGGMTNPAGVDVDDAYAYVGAKLLRRVPKNGGTADRAAKH